MYSACSIFRRDRDASDDQVLLPAANVTIASIPNPRSPRYSGTVQWLFFVLALGGPTAPPPLSVTVQPKRAVVAFKKDDLSERGFFTATLTNKSDKPLRVATNEHPDGDGKSFTLPGPGRYEIIFEYSFYCHTDYPDVVNGPIYSKPVVVRMTR